MNPQPLGYKIALQPFALSDVEPNELGPSEEPIKMPKPDERNSRTAAKKSGLVKTPHQQSAFAAQNLEDVVMYDVERVRMMKLKR